MGLRLAARETHSNERGVALRSAGVIHARLCVGPHTDHLPGTDGNESSAGEVS